MLFLGDISSDNQMNSDPRRKYENITKGRKLEELSSEDLNSSPWVTFY